MADTDVLVSELDSASAINTNDLLLMTQPDGDAETGYASRKGTVLQTATKMLKGIEFTTDLPHFTDKTVLGALEELSTGKANTSGEYNGLISGQANALKPSARLENSTPYLFRPSFSNGYGYETLIGGTCCVNQLVDTGDTSVNTISGHKYLTRINGVENIIAGGSAVSINDSSEDNVIDLTAMFDTTIADYVYTLESGTAGAGVAWLKAYAPQIFGKYNAYNAGELISVKTSKHITVGFNQWDEQWEYVNSRVTSKNYIPVVPDTVYYFGNTKLYDVEMFDTSKNSLGNPTYTGVAGGFLFTTASNCAFIKFSVANSYGTTYLNDICINISCDLDGQYEHYVKHEYDLSGSRLVHRKFGIVDLGSVNWTYQDGIFQTEYENFKGVTGATIGNYICSKYISSNAWTIYGGSTDKIFYVSTDHYIRIKDTDYTDKDVFRASVNGVYLICELTEPFDETVSNPELRGIVKLDSNNKLYYYGDTCDDFTNPQIVDVNGTEQFVDGRTVEMPVGHDTFYIPMN